jgi:hypothetical protein
MLGKVEKRLPASRQLMGLSHSKASGAARIALALVRTLGLDAGRSNHGIDVTAVGVVAVERLALAVITYVCRDATFTLRRRGVGRLLK